MKKSYLVKIECGSPVLPAVVRGDALVLLFLFKISDKAGLDNTVCIRRDNYIIGRRT